MKAKPLKTRAAGTWTEARYWGFIRSGLRRMWMRWPAQYAVRRAAARPYAGPNKRQQWEFLCAHCKEWVMGKETNVHHKTPCGTLKCFADLAGFVERLFCEPHELELVCKRCHKKEHDE